MGEGRYGVTYFKPWHYMVVSYRFHASTALVFGKVPIVSIKQEAGPKNWSGCLWEETGLLLTPENG